MKMPAAQREECYRVVLIRRQSGWPRVRTDVCLLQRLPDPHRAQLEQDFLQEQEGGFGKPHLGPTDGREARTAMRLLPSEGEEETLGVAWRGARKRKPEAAWGPRLRAGPMAGLPPPRRRAGLAARGKSLPLGLSRSGPCQAELVTFHLQVLCYARCVCQQQRLAPHGAGLRSGVANTDFPASPAEADVCDA